MKARERIYIVPTWAGAVLAGAVLLTFAVGYISEGFGGTPQVLVIALVVAGIVVLIQTNDNMRGICLSTGRVPPVPVGSEAVVSVLVTNTSQGERLGLKVRYREGWKLLGQATIPVIEAGGSVRVEIRIPTARRGIFPLPPIWVSSNFPAGLCFAWKVLRDAGSHAVYPRGRSWRPLPGSAVAVKSGGEEIGESRPYLPGDPLSRVDWKVFARTGTLAVRTFEDPGGRLAIRWEDTAFLEDPEDRLEQLSAWVQAAVRLGRGFDLHLGGAGLYERNLDGCRAALAGWGAGK